MQGLITWIGTACGALFVVAVAVAWWEHLVRSKQVRTAHQKTSTHAITVDVCLDTLTAEAPGDSAERRAALDSAIVRMTQPGTPGTRSAWLDTRPMVQPGPREVSRAASRSERSTDSPTDTPVDTAASPLT